MSSTIKFRCLDNSGNNIFLIDSLEGVYSTNTTESTNSSSGAIYLHGGLSINKTSNSISVSQGGALTIAGGASIGKDVYIGGNLTVYGTQTQFISQTLNISDNLIVVNSSPVSGRDAGILFHRFQTENNSNLGDVVTDTATFSTVISARTTNTITFDVAANSTDNYYTNWYIKITNGPGISQVRQITNYVGSTRTATINTNWNTLPDVGNSVNFYNKIYASQYYKETDDSFVLAYTTSDTNTTVDIGDYIGLQSGYIQIFNTNNAIGLGSGGSLTTLGGVSIAKDVYIGGPALKIPVGTTAERPGSVQSGFIRYNSETNQFEGYGPGNAWGSLGGVVDIAQTTKILASASPSTTDGNLYFYTTGNERMRINSAGNVGVGTTAPTNNLDVTGTGRITTSLTTGALYSTNQTSTNIVGTNVSFGTLTVSGGFSASAANATLLSLTSSLNVTTAALYSTNQTSTNIVGTNVTVSNLRVTDISSGTLNLSNGLISVNSQVTSQTVGTSRITSNLLALGNSNTLGNLFTTGGNVGIGTNSPGELLDVRGNLRIGGSAQANYISFFGTSGDGAGEYNHTYIGERICVGEQSELLLFKGNDSNLASGPDRIRLLAAEHRFDTYSFLTGTFEGVGTSGTTRMIIDNSGNVGIGNIPGSLLDVQSASSTSGIHVSISDSFTSGQLLSVERWGADTMMLVRADGNVGIGTTSPTHQLNLTRTQLISSTQGLGSNNPTSVSGGALNVSGDFVLSGTRGIYFTSHGVGIPTTTTRSIGTKIVLWPVLNSSVVDYAIGIENRNVWNSVDTEESGFKWYQGLQNTMSLQTRGHLILHSTTNSSGFGTGGTLTVLGGASIDKDVYIGQNLYVNGQNLSSISGNTTIGNYTGTGVLEITGIAIGKTMSNTNYKINGNLVTTTNNTNVYTVSFKNLTTTTFDAVIYRIDSLGSGWTDTNLKLSWYITP